MGNWITTQPVDFTPDGDTTSSAIKKHDVDIANIYELLHRVRRFDFGPNPPADPVDGHLWAVDGGDGKPIFLRMYKNGKWHRLSFIAISNPTDPPPAEGVLRVSKDSNGVWRLLVYHNGAWVIATPYDFSVSGKMVQMTQHGVLSINLFDDYFSRYNPTSDFDLQVGEMVRYWGTAQNVNLHVNANNGLYKITYCVSGGSVGNSHHKLKLNNTVYDGKFVLLSNKDTESSGETNDYFSGSGVDSLYIGYGTLGIFTGIVNTRSTNVCSVFRGHADQSDKNRAMMILGSHMVQPVTISKLGTIDFRSSCSYLISVERLL